MFEPGTIFGRKHKLTITYKSGVRVHVKCDKFEIVHKVSGAIEYAWDGLEPGVMLMNVDEIESVWHGWL